MAVSKQWDIGSSVFSLKGMALGLLRAATVDEVQPAAVLAAKALGSTLLVDSSLIEKAVDALVEAKAIASKTLKCNLESPPEGLHPSFASLLV